MNMHRTILPLTLLALFFSAQQIYAAAITETFTNPPIENTQGNPYSLNILSYNTALLEIKAQDFLENFTAFFKGEYRDSRAKNKEEATLRDRRGELIGPVVKDFEVVVFQETFDHSARKALRIAARDNGFYYNSGILGSGLRATYKASADDCLKDWHTHPDQYQMGRAYEQPDGGVLKLQELTNEQIKRLKHGEQHMCVIGDVGNDGGVMTISQANPFMAHVGEYIFEVDRHPITADKLKRNPDVFANKGVVYAKLFKNRMSLREYLTQCVEKFGATTADTKPWFASSQVYHIFATHLQACYRGKSEEWKAGYREQMRSEIDDISKYIQSFKIPDNEPIFIVGDMNILDKNVNPENKHLQHQYEKDLYDYMVNKLNAYVPPVEGPTYNPGQDFKDTKPSATEVQRIDYVMIVKNGALKLLKKSFNKLYAIKANSPWLQKDGQQKYSLSDHEAMYGYFEFEPKQ